MGGGGRGAVVLPVILAGDEGGQDRERASTDLGQGKRTARGSSDWFRLRLGSRSGVASWVYGGAPRRQTHALRIDHSSGSKRKPRR